MAKTANGTVTGQDWFTNAISLTFDDEYAYVGHNVENNSNVYRIYCLRFKMPKFSGKSVKLTVGLSLQRLSNSTVTFNYALCTSADNCQNYCWKMGDVTDDTQIVSGNQQFTILANYGLVTLDIETDALKSEETYYLYVWGKSQYSLSTVNTIDNHTVALTYKSNGGVRITTSAAQNKLHAAVIYVNGAWKRYIPVVYTANGWKRQG